jgi:hypothetical protein
MMFEEGSEISLAVAANVLRVIGDDGARVRDLPRLSGVSKESIAMALGYLEKRRYAVVRAAPEGRSPVVALSDKGRAARDAYGARVQSIEKAWGVRYGSDVVRAIRDALEPLVGTARADESPLFLGLEPPPASWRASVPRPVTLPHFPMVLHRGGYPDGA